MFGADYARGRMVTGVSLSHSRGLGSYAGVDTGQVTSAVTGLYPWIGPGGSLKATRASVTRLRTALERTPRRCHFYTGTMVPTYRTRPTSPGTGATSRLS